MTDVVVHHVRESSRDGLAVACTFWCRLSLCRRPPAVRGVVQHVSACFRVFGCPFYECPTRLEYIAIFSLTVYRGCAGSLSPARSIRCLQIPLAHLSPHFRPMGSCPRQGYFSLSSGASCATACSGYGAFRFLQFHCTRSHTQRPGCTAHKVIVAPNPLGCSMCVLVASPGATTMWHRMSAPPGVWQDADVYALPRPFVG